MVIDDERIVCDMARLSLEQEGADILCFNKGFLGV